MLRLSGTCVLLIASACAVSSRRQKLPNSFFSSVSLHSNLVSIIMHSSVDDAIADFYPEYHKPDSAQLQQDPAPYAPLGKPAPATQDPEAAYDEFSNIESAG
eukprot:248218-Rhodomonas_salina.1